MSVLDPAQRTRTGVQQQAELLAAPAPEPGTLLEASWRDFVFAEVWTRPGLDRRSRYLISIASAACEGGRPDVLDGYVRGALNLGELKLVELREAALQLAVYAGWSRGVALDTAVTRAAKELGLPPADVCAHSSAGLGSEAAYRRRGREFHGRHDFSAASAADTLFRRRHSQFRVR